MTPTGKQPLFHTMTDEECRAVLRRNHVGRLAFSFRDRVDIQPLHYVLEGEWLYGRTSEGAKLLTIAHHQWVAFEVDEIHGLFDWTSVVVHGAFTRLDDNARTSNHESEARGIELLRTLVPDTFTDDDPVAFRRVVFRIALTEMTGRRASQGGG
jgi:nitroimidazol reductase NimA-like FMN-containing flavoprotein (pyridoxamine 5'-phosphate oxidase superfamily)